MQAYTRRLVPKGRFILYIRQPVFCQGRSDIHTGCAERTRPKTYSTALDKIDGLKKNYFTFLTLSPSPLWNGIRYTMLGNKS